MDATAQLSAALAGRYEIEREVGAGGMATVYLARDVKHARQVALKVLRPDLAAALGAERFLAEIRTTANLQHPHILPLHDSGEADGYLFYVMPFVAGETLRARLEREQLLPIDDAVRIATETLSALDYAHRHGVVHRDIKPENILLHDGSALVADFGIALAVTAAGGSRMTQTGLSLGTPQYMSPEQAMGEKHIDGRADVYATGAVLYEMLTGEPPFSGASVQAIVAKVMTERPTPPSTVRDTVPRGVETAVMKALAKLPADRFASAAQFAEALAQPDLPGARIGGAAHGTIPASRRSRVLGVAVGVMFLALVGTWLFTWRRITLASDDRVAFEIPISESGTVGLAVSPDGRRVAMTMVVDSVEHRARQLVIRDIGSTVATLVPGTTAASTLLGWSPDGHDLVYAATELGARPKLMRASADRGGVPQQLTEDPIGVMYGPPTWGRDGQILISDAGRLSVVPASGGHVRHLYADSLHLPPQLMPRFLPDGKRFLFATGFQSSDAGVWIGTLDGARPRKILPILSRPMVANGQIFTVRDGVLLAQPFDERAGEPRGEARRVASNILSVATSGMAFFDVSPGGTVVYRQGTYLGLTGQLRWFDRSGKPLGTVGDPYSGAEMNLSPDERFVALDAHDEARVDVWALDLRTGIRTRVTSDSGSNSPIWFPDARTVLYQSRAGGRTMIRSRRVGGARDSLVYEGRDPGALLVDDISADGTRLLYNHGATSLLTLFELPLAGGTPRGLLSRPGLTQAHYSPDGRWVSFESTETGTREIYVATYPAFDRVMRVSVRGGTEARWRGDSRELFYLASSDWKMMAVPVNPTSSDPFGAPVELFQSPLASTTPGNDKWSVTHDGQRFLFLAPATDQSAKPMPVTVIVHWRPNET